MSTRAPEVEVIRLWIKDGRSREVDSLRPAEIGGARHRDRLLDCAIIDGVLYIERRVAPTVREQLGRHLVEVYVADALYAKNERGASSVSAPRMAAYLGLSERTVRHIRDLLVELRLQGRERGGRSGDRHWPIIPRTLATTRISRVWWLDATSGFPAGNPEVHGLPDLAGGYPEASRPNAEGTSPKSGSEGCATDNDFSDLAAERRLESDIGIAPKRAIPMSAEARLARELDALRAQRPIPSVEERARVAALARDVTTRHQREERQRSHDPDAVARAMAGDDMLRIRSGITPQHLEEALASLRRLQGGNG
jgi:hypothetical protein